MDEIAWPAARLVQECLNGNELAWLAMIEKYKNLIYSIPVRWGFSEADSSDIFQSVVADLLSELGRLREPQALGSWLIQVTAHRCMEWRRQQAREAGTAARDGEAGELAADGAPAIESLLIQANREQTVREAVFSASPRCRQLIQMLFFEEPSLPYLEVAAKLGIATGSIGFIRRRCLNWLKAYLEKAEFA